MRSRFQGDVEYLVGTCYDVRKGSLVREGRVRLSNRSAPAGSLTALASFLVTGQQSNLVATGSTPAEPPRGKRSLEVKPPPRPPEPDLTAVSTENPSRTKGWVAVGSGALAVGLGILAIAEGVSARSKYDDARAMLGPDGKLALSADPTQYNRLIDDGNSARSVSYVGTGAAIGAAAVAGVLGYYSYKRTGEIGPFRF